MFPSTSPAHARRTTLTPVQKMSQSMQDDEATALCQGERQVARYSSPRSFPWWQHLASAIVCRHGSLWLLACIPLPPCTCPYTYFEFELSSLFLLFYGKVCSKKATSVHLDARANHIPADAVVCQPVAVSLNFENEDEHKIGVEKTGTRG